MFFLRSRCEVCKAFTPEWHKVGEEISDDKKRIQVADFDCNANKKACDDLWVELYPTFMVIDNGELMIKVKPFLGQLTSFFR